MANRIPTDGTFELTVRCNLHCKMCMFRHDDCENNDIMKRELTVSQWIRMAEQAAEAGTFSLLITGGEPMVRQDFCEIWEGIYRQGFLITLYTNAVLVSDKVMETLRRFPPHTIGVTLYGSSKQTYQNVCGDGNAFEKALEGIRKLKTLPSRFEYRMTVIKDNYDDVEAVENLVREKLDPDAMVENTRMVFRSVRGGCMKPEECRLEPEQNVLLAYRRSIGEIKRITGDRFDQGVIGLRVTEEECRKEKREMPSLFGCSAGMSSYTVSWDGKLLGCQMMGLFSVPIEGDFTKAWEKYPKTVNPLTVWSEKCSACDLKSQCMSCPASRMAETAGKNEDYQYICRDAETMKRLLQNGEVYEKVRKAEDHESQPAE